MSSRSRRLRHWAACMLLLWLFGIGCGIAQACAGSHLQAATDGIGRGQTSAVGDCEQHHGEQGGLAQAHCRDFCDNASTSVPTVQPSLNGLFVLALMPAVINTVAPVPALSLARAGVLRPPDRPARPITLTYLRLAL